MEKGENMNFKLVFRVLGQLLPGVSVWRTGEESRFPGLPYVIFPGYAGEADSLRQAAEILEAGRRAYAQ